MKNKLEKLIHQKEEEYNKEFEKLKKLEEEFKLLMEIYKKLEGK